jgi:hypothetical protein
LQILSSKFEIEILKRTINRRICRGKRPLPMNSKITFCSRRLYVRRVSLSKSGSPVSPEVNINLSLATGSFQQGFLTLILNITKATLTDSSPFSLVVRHL